MIKNKIREEFIDILNKEKNTMSQLDLEIINYNIENFIKI